MSLRTFGQRSYAARTFNARTFNGNETAETGVPSGGVVASQLSRSVFARPDRCVDASQFNRVVVALPERIR